MCTGVVTLCASKRLLSAVNQHVLFQMSSFDACVATLVATVELLSIILNQVYFKVFGHLEGEIVFNLHFHGMILVASIRQQS